MPAQQQAGQLTQANLQRKCRHRHERRAVQHPAQGLGKLAVTHRVWRAGIIRTVGVLLVQKKINQGDLILDMHPGHPLPPIANRPAQRQFERQQQARQKPPSADSTNPVRTSTTRMPRLRHAGRFPPRRYTTGWEIILHRAAGFGQFALAAIAVPTHRRTGDQHRRFLLQAFHPGQQGFGEVNATAPQQRLALVGPRPVGNRRACQVDHRVHRANHLLQTRHPKHLCTTHLGDRFRLPAPYGQAMPLCEPVLAELATDQAGTAGQQNMHGTLLM